MWTDLTEHLSALLLKSITSWSGRREGDTRWLIESSARNLVLMPRSDLSFLRINSVSCFSRLLRSASKSLNWFSLRSISCSRYSNSWFILACRAFISSASIFFICSSAFLQFANSKMSLASYSLSRLNCSICVFSSSLSFA